MAKAQLETVSIIVPTFRRPDGLKQALESLESQTVHGFDVEIIVADNDPKASARDYIYTYAKSAKFKTKYLHVPEPGVSNARNGALSLARGRYLAFLDDDQVAGENWLATLLHISQKYQAALAFVPTIARIPGPHKNNDYFKNFFSRFGPAINEGIIDRFFGCGNSLIDTKLCVLPNPAFSTDMNETGGEDDLLYSALQSQGIQIAWSRSATAYEDIRPHRATAQYVKIRSFANGQGPSQECADTKNWLGVGKWMLVGAVQYCAFTPLALFSKAFGRANYVHLLAKSAAGAGKVLWFGGFTPKLYGAAIVEKANF